MIKKIIIVTGAAGFIGSSIVVALSKEYNIIAIDQRQPTHALIKAAPNIKWEKLDISNANKVYNTFQKIEEDLGTIDFVIHLAAYYHFGNDWRIEYEKSNIRGTENIIKASIKQRVGRIIFTSSIAAMVPPPRGDSLTEKSAVSDYFPYAKSKSEGEKIIKNASGEIPGIVLRLAGVFSDWCELPPLYSLMKLWLSSGPFSKTIPGKGESGIPYIHIIDTIRIIKRCIQLSDQLDSFEIFLASQNGAVMHKDLFSSVTESPGNAGSVKPIYVPLELVKIGLNIKIILGSFVNKIPFEQNWMLEFIDRPWTVENSYTQKKLDWQCKSNMNILERLPVILNHFKTQKNNWIERNTVRILGEYFYS